MIRPLLQGDECANKVIRGRPSGVITGDGSSLQIPVELPDLDNAFYEIIQLLKVVPDRPGRKSNADVHLLGFAFRSDRNAVVGMDQQVGRVLLEAHLSVGKIPLRRDRSGNTALSQLQAV